jgi:hypothetical protein
MSMGSRGSMVGAVVLAVLVSTLLVACGGGNGYAGTWIGPSVKAGEGQRAVLVIAKANEGWWSIDSGTKDMPHVIYAAEIGGELQTGNGRNTFRASGDKLLVTMFPGDPAVEFTRQ